MWPVVGSLIAQRFQILEVAGFGAMGVVFRVLDQSTGQTAALKLLRSDDADHRESQRLFREAQVLAKLRHPRIVAHITHGMTEQGQPFLAMEWLDGEDLARRLCRGPLSLAESVTLLRNVADALSAAHEQGVIHRDIKPSNIFLRHGEVENAVVVDFGIARQSVDINISLSSRTQTGIVVGTPDYMAPEQARGQRAVSPRTDLFALGGVFYECLSGQPPFAAEHVVGVLAKILFEEPPPLRQLRPETPVEIEELATRLLQKDPEQRPRDGQELMALIRALPTVLAVPPSDGLPSTSIMISSAEQHVVSVLVASAETTRGERIAGPQTTEPQLDSTLLRHRELLASFGAASAFVAEGALIATLRADARRTVADQAAQAARMALALRARWPGATLALCTGRGVLRERLMLGEAIDRAVGLLQLPAAASAPSEGVITDGLTARLLAARFVLAPRGGALHCLLGERSDPDEPRLLLGKPTPCVGREQELSTLDSIYSAAVGDSQASAVLVIAGPGMGKSRLRQEFVRRVRAGDSGAEVLLGHGDALSASSSYGILRKALCRLAGVQDGEPLDEQQRKLRLRVERHLLAHPRQAVVEFLGELCGIPFADQSIDVLQRARRDPPLMGESMSAALIEFLRGECSAHPLLLILEDIQWADPLSLRLVERALRQLAEHPLLVLALSRPEVKEIFPNLWSGRLQELALRGLSKRAAEKLAAEALGRGTPEAVVARVVAQASGNALYLEELIRTVSEDGSAELPETVVAMLQSRLARLGGESRRVLRAASVFGETFFCGGVLSLLGGKHPGFDVETCLEDLVGAEILERHRDSRLPGESEYGFRHALLRDAAYALLTAEDLRIGHRRAAEYLEEKCEPDPLVLAAHYALCADPTAAIPWYIRAGDAASRICALPQARAHFQAAYALLPTQSEDPQQRRQHIDVLIRQAQSGMLAEPTALNLSRLTTARTLLTELSADGESTPDDLRRSAWVDFLRGRTHYYANQQLEAIAYCQRVLPIAEQLGDETLMAIPSLVIGGALITQGQAGQARTLLSRACQLERQLDSDYERLRMEVYYGVSLVMCGHYEEGMAMHQRGIERARAGGQPAGLSMAYVIRACSLRFCGDFAAMLGGALDAVEQAEKSGDRIYSFMGLSLAGWAHAFLGNHAQAVELRAKAQQLARESGIRMLADWYAAGDAEIALRGGRLSEALALAEQLAPALRRERRHLGLAIAEQVWGLALGLRAPGDPDCLAAAEQHLWAALWVMEQSEQLLAAACLRLEWAWLARRHGEWARAAALREQAMTQLARSGCAPQLFVERFERAQAPLDAAFGPAKTPPSP